MTNPVDRNCSDLPPGTPPLSTSEREELMRWIDPDWNIVDDHHLIRTLSFDNFHDALHHATILGTVADEQNHHPELTITWGKLQIRIWTHTVDGLSENDFILAAKYDELSRHLTLQ
jgi:4a-hydroxytetrahydrobiopterin dehydratase